MFAVYFLYMYTMLWVMLTFMLTGVGWGGAC